MISFFSFPVAAKYVASTGGFYITFNSLIGQLLFVYLVWSLFAFTLNLVSFSELTHKLLPQSLIFFPFSPVISSHFSSVFFHLKLFTLLTQTLAPKNIFYCLDGNLVDNSLQLEFSLQYSVSWYESVFPHLYL